MKFLGYFPWVQICTHGYRIGQARFVVRSSGKLQSCRWLPGARASIVQARKRYIVLRLSCQRLGLPPRVRYHRVMNDRKPRPAHGCYVCRRFASHSVIDTLNLVHQQHGCEPYPDCEVSVYECPECRGLWLLVRGCSMNLRENHARELFPDIKLE